MSLQGFYLSPLFWIIVGAAVIVGILVGVLLARKKGGGGEGSAKGKRAARSWDDLMRTRQVTSVLSVSHIIAWATACTKFVKKGDSSFLFKTTENNVERLGYPYKADMDSEKNIIACVINMKTGDMKCMKLFSFSSMSPKAEELFRGGDSAVVSLPAAPAPEKKRPKKVKVKKEKAKE